MLRLSIPIKTLSFLTFLIECLVAELNRALPRYHSEEMQILNTLFPKVGIEPTHKHHGAVRQFLTVKTPCFWDPILTRENKLY